MRCWEPVGRVLLCFLGPFLISWGITAVNMGGGGSFSLDPGEDEQERKGEREEKPFSGICVCVWRVSA